MGKAYENKKKTAQAKSKTNALATQKKINTINRNKLPYNTVLKPTWTYGIQLWGQPPVPTHKSSSAFNPRLSGPF
jgi:hypothetical protein